MGKQPQMTRQGTRYEPYKNSSRRRGSPPPDSWGIHAGSQDAQLDGGIFDLLEALNTRYGSRDLRELFRDHANQPGALGQAIETWIQYDEIRGPRQPDQTDFFGTQHQGEPSLPPALSGSPGGLLFISPHCSPKGSTGDEVPGLQTSPGQRYPTSNTRPHATDSPPLSLLQLMRGVEAPPLFSMPPLEPSGVHESSNRSEGSLAGHDERGRISRRSSEESVHAAFWETAGWTPEDGYPGFREEGCRIPTHLKGKGRARLQEGGETPEEQGFSGWRPPQPGDLPYAVSSLNGEFVSPEYLINIEPQDEDPILMAMRQEGQQDGHKQPPRPEPQPEPELRRSARIKAKKQDAVPPKVKTPAKSTSRKRAVRKK